MKFSLFSILALAASSVVSAVDVELGNSQDALEGEFVDPKAQTPFQFNIDYKIEGKDASADVIELYNGEETVLQYTFENLEEDEITVVGVSGSFRDPRSGQIMANITDAKIGPLVIPSGEAKVFTQRIGINLPTGSYLLAPGIYIVKDSALALVGTRTKLVLIDDQPISIFSPQLVILEILLLVTLALGGYFVWVNFGADYLKSVSKASVDTKKVSQQSTSTSTGAKKVVDESWLPEGHAKKTNKRKAK